jgi:tetratricopeptide (TPR) repeat protein
VQVCTPYAKGTARLLAAELAWLAAIGRRAGAPDKSKALAALALKLDPACFGALFQLAQAAADEKKPDDALRLIGQATTLWPAYAAPHLLEGELQTQKGSRARAEQAYRAGIAAKLKPYGSEAGFNAECYYRIADLYAPLAQAALKAGSAAAVGYYKKFNAAILECLKLNPGHPKAAELLKKMGGSITPR